MSLRKITELMEFNDLFKRGKLNYLRLAAISSKLK